MKKLGSILIKISPLLVLSFLTIGYAVIFQDLQIGGRLELKKAGIVEITGINLDDSLENPLSEYGSITLDQATGTILLDYDFTLTGQNEPTTYSAVYLVHINNGSPLSYTFEGFNLNPDVSLSNEHNGGANVSYQLKTDNPNNTLIPGDEIPPYNDGTVAIEVSITVSSSSAINISVNGEGSVDVDLDETGELLASLKTSEVNLRGSNTIDCFNVEVINTFPYQRILTFGSSNRNFILVKNDGSALDTFTINPPDENDATANDVTFNMCIKAKDGATFVGNSSKTTITMNAGTATNESVGVLNVLVDKQETPTFDDLPPEITIGSFSMVKYNKNDGSLSVKATWTGNDSHNADITNYIVKVYDEADPENAIASTQTNSSVETLTFDIPSSTVTDQNANMNTNNHTYYITVSGVDANGNAGEGFCSEANSVYCGKSTPISLKHRFTVTTGGNNTSYANTGKVAYFGNDYSIVVNANNNYTLNDTITVTRTGTSGNLRVNTDYTYTSSGNTGSSATITIKASAVTNNLSITASATSNGGGTCLREGTKILLANGKYKNVEDIEYTDLLAVYSHEQGRIVYEYPIWIEIESYADNYQRTYFSDGTYIDTYNNHGLFSMDQLKYVSVLDQENFHKGTNVAKFDKNGNIKVVSVTNQETFKDKIKYYHISSVRYHNIIANDLLTTDGVLQVSNMYTFNPDITWGIDRDVFLKEIENDTEYDLPVFPRHIYRGFRGPETKKLFVTGELNLLEYVRLLNGRIYEPLKDKMGNNLWVVGTSNGDESLHPEGSIYVVPKPKYNKGIFVGWYNTGNNKYYMPGDTFTVDYSMYLEAIYK